MKSGLFNRDAITKECPEGYIKICEGTTAVLLAPTMPADASKTSVDATHQGNERHFSKTTSAQLRSDNHNAEHGNEDQSVFYNPAQVVNRDLSVCAIETFSQIRLREPRRRGGVSAGLTILEALSATGLRAIRYYKEISNIRYIIANDLDAGAVECIARNCAYNNVPLAQPTLDENFPSSLVTVSLPSNAENEGMGRIPGEITSGGGIVPNLDDAVDLMHRLALNPGVHSGKRFCLLEKKPAVVDGGGMPSEEWGAPRPVLQQELMDVVDLDPYGTASPFLDAAFGCIKEGGLMLVTSTDSAILCGNYPGTCHAKYDSIPYKSAHCHEMAVRILLACMERAANKHKKYIAPLLSLHIDFYVRCFVRVFTQPAEVKLSASKLGYQLQCTNCPAFWVRPIAVARGPRPPRRGKKRPREPNQPQPPFSDASNEERMKPNSPDASLEETKAGVPSIEDSDMVRWEPEIFPPAPSRTNDPKLTALTLQMLPQLVCQDSKRGSAEQGSPADPGSKAAGGLRVKPTDAVGNPPLPPRVSDDLHGSGCGVSKGDFCPVCGSSIALSGPIYAAPTQNGDFLTDLMQTVQSRAEEGKITAAARITGLVQVALEELPQCPLFYRLPDLASYVKTRCPPTPLFVAALARLGYSCSQVHCEPSGIKTDCPPPILFAVMLRWKQLSEGNPAESEEESKASDAMEESASAPRKPRGDDLGGGVPKILVSPLKSADFSYDRQHDFRRQVTGLAKFIPNAPGWGPKRRHQGTAPIASEEF
ncbi:unnamed protein product [Phytomonas sp. EM1]|nr:unnamed protein product [Phytomonas sp. EM1]|eukprot:CCW61853.1 unnamed protein product [Phytomonas sp. isolate EM1]